MGYARLGPSRKLELSREKKQFNMQRMHTFNRPPSNTCFESN